MHALVFNLLQLYNVHQSVHFLHDLLNHQRVHDQVIPPCIGELKIELYSMAIQFHQAFFSNYI